MKGVKWLHWFIKAYYGGFEDVHYGGHWVKILTDEEYRDILNKS